VSRQQVAVGGERFHQGVDIGAVVVGMEHGADLRAAIASTE
jgi:hypothetical protein